MKESNIEVFILTYNRVNYLKYAVNSILNQHLKPYKLTIIDNGSNDGTSNFCQDLVSKGVNYFRIEKNNQFGIWNEIKNLVISEYLMIFHDDDLLHFNYLSYVQNIIDTNKQVVMVGCATGISSISNIENYCFSQASFKYKFYNTTSLAGLLFSGFPLPFCSIVYKKEYFCNANFNFELYGKFFDRPLILDISKHGDVVIIKNKLVKTFIHTNQDSMSIRNGGNEYKLIAVIKSYKDILGTSFLNRWSYVFFIFNYKRLLNFYYWNGNESSKIKFLTNALKYSATNRFSLIIGFIYYYFFDVKSKVRWLLNFINYKL
jgi:glycosyltransferase involved in cell wall biosynthesis